MCPADHTDDDPEDAAADTASGGAEAASEPNKVVGPLTDEELQTGGLDRVVSFIRSEPTKESLRKKRQRKKQKEKNGKRQMNIVVLDDDRSRATMRGAATAIEDDVGHQAIEAILANAELGPLILDVAAQPELREIVDLARHKDGEQHSVTTELLDAAKLIIEHPGVVALMKRAIATGRMREAVETAIANPEYVFLGRIVATQRSVCTWLARLLLRIRRNPGANRAQ